MNWAPTEGEPFGLSTLEYLSEWAETANEIGLKCFWTVRQGDAYAVFVKDEKDLPNYCGTYMALDWKLA